MMAPLYWRDKLTSAQLMIRTCRDQNNQPPMKHKGAWTIRTYVYFKCFKYPRGASGRYAAFGTCKPCVCVYVCLCPSSVSVFCPFSTHASYMSVSSGNKPNSFSNLALKDLGRPWFLANPWQISAVLQQD